MERHPSPLRIEITGGYGSGKQFIAEKIAKALREDVGANVRVETQANPDDLEFIVDGAMDASIVIVTRWSKEETS
jgi:nucleoside-triphosphatase THEP1